MSYKLPEWTIRLDGDVLGVLYVETIEPAAQRAIIGLLSVQQQVDPRRITIQQVESKLLKESSASAEMENKDSAT